MKVFLVALAVLACLVIAADFYVRLAPSDPARWHVDPEAAADPGEGGVRLPFEAGRSWPGSPEDVLAELARIAEARPRVTRLAGSPEEGRMTWVARSKLWGFPDYVTVAARPDDAGGTRLAILSRLRFGQGDMGVNAARVEAWKDALAKALEG